MFDRRRARLSLWQTFASVILYISDLGMSQKEFLHENGDDDWV